MRGLGCLRVGLDGVKMRNLRGVGAGIGRGFVNWGTVRDLVDVLSGEGDWVGLIKTHTLC